MQSQDKEKIDVTDDEIYDKMQALIAREHPLKKIPLKDVLPIADVFVRCFKRCCCCCKPSTKEAEPKDSFEHDVAQYERDLLQEYQGVIWGTSKENWTYDTLISKLRQTYSKRKPLPLNKKPPTDSENDQNFDVSPNELSFTNFTDQETN